MQNNEATLYDYIIIGTGPAGCVLANRLSAGGHTVLALEAGPNLDGDPAVQNYNGGSMMHIPKYFWPDVMEAQPNLKGVGFQVTGTGRLAGGGSSVNGQVFVRPSPYVLRQWEQLAGPQWAPEKVYARFGRMEDFNGAHTRPGAHGSGGPLDIRQTYQNGGALLQKLAGALTEATDLLEVEDYNDPEIPMGPYQRLQVYQKPDGKRASASVSYLGGADRPTLRVKYETTATKVLFNESKRAVGVEYIEKGKSGSAAASQKVIVCAGLRSAHLLQLSGVGPRAVLEKAGIPVVHDSPKVGQTLVNDAYARAIFMVNPADTAALQSADIGTYWRGGAFLPSALPGRPKDKRQNQLLFMDIGNNMLMLVILNIDPKSHGSIKVQSADPLKVMSLDEGFLSDAADLEELKATLRVYVKGMADALHAKDLAYMMVAPSPDVLADDAKLEDFIRSGFTQNYHEQCSLAMGTAPDAAVNGWCEVNGVENLLVADTSVIPYHSDGNPSACSYVIGETLAAHLLGEE